MPNSSVIQPTDLQSPDNLYNPRTGVLFPSRARLVAITALIVLTLVAVLFLAFYRPPLSDAQKWQVARDTLAKVESAALSGDHATVDRFCSDRFLMLASDKGVDAPRNLNWKAIKTWFAKRQGKWKNHPSTQGFATYRFVDAVTFDDPLSYELFGAVFNPDGTFYFDVSICSIDADGTLISPQTGKRLELPRQSTNSRGTVKDES